MSSNRMLAEVNKDEDSFISRITARFYRHPNTFVSTMLVGNNIALVVYGILFAKLFDETLFADFPEASKVTCDTILSTFVVLFTGEFLPKTLFKSAPNRFLDFFALPAYLCYILLYPLSRFSTLSSRLLLKVLGVKVEKDSGDGVFTKVDLDYLVQEAIEQASDKESIEEEVRIFQNALDFSDTKVRECMIPRTEICAIDKEADIDEMRQKFIESGHSKVIVYEEDIDNIVGYIHSSDLFRPIDVWQNNIRQLSFVPETMQAKRLMRLFLQQKKSLAVVVDEFGGTSGVVSLEDIVEEIVGEINDEHDSTQYVCRPVGENEFIISARMEIDQVNEILDIDLPEDESYKTVGGLILDRYQKFPKINEEIVIDEKFKIKVIKNTKTKIELVKLFLL